MTEFVIADCGIRQLHARFVDAVWRMDAAAFAECFAEDAEWKIAGLHMRGRAEIGATFARLMATSARVLMCPGQPVLEVGEGTATGRVYITEYAKLRDGQTARTIGVYYDRYVGEGYRWAFRSRHWTLCYRGPADFSAPFLDCPDYGPHPGMPGPDEPSVARKA